MRRDPSGEKNHDKTTNSSSLNRYSRGKAQGHKMKGEKPGYCGKQKLPEAKEDYGAASSHKRFELLRKISEGTKKGHRDKSGKTKRFISSMESGTKEVSMKREKKITATNRSN